MQVVKLCSSSVAALRGHAAAGTPAQWDHSSARIGACGKVGLLSGTCSSSLRCGSRVSSPVCSPTCSAQRMRKGEMTEWASQLVGRVRQQGHQPIVITYSTLSAHADRFSERRGPCSSLADAAAGPPAQRDHLRPMLCALDGGQLQGLRSM